MSGDLQARRGGGSKLKNRNKKKAMLQELEKQEYQQERLSQSGGDDQPTSKKGKKNKSSPKRRRQNQKQQQSNYQYYGEVSDDDDGSYDYDIAAPRRSSSVLGWCIKIFLFVVVLGGLGLTGLYFKSEEDFRAIVNIKRLEMLKQFGANSVMPDLQGIPEISFNLAGLGDSVKLNLNTDGLIKAWESTRDCIGENVVKPCLQLKEELTEQVQDGIQKIRDLIGGQWHARFQSQEEAPLPPPPPSQQPERPQEQPQLEQQQRPPVVQPSFTGEAKTPEVKEREPVKEPPVVEKTMYTVGQEGGIKPGK